MQRMWTGLSVRIEFHETVEEDDTELVTIWHTLRGPTAVQFKPNFVHKVGQYHALPALYHTFCSPNAQSVSYPTSRLSAYPCECAIAEVPKQVSVSNATSRVGTLANAQLLMFPSMYLYPMQPRGCRRTLANAQLLMFPSTELRKICKFYTCVQHHTTNELYNCDYGSIR